MGDNLNDQNILSEVHLQGEVGVGLDRVRNRERLGEEEIPTF